MAKDYAALIRDSLVSADPIHSDIYEGNYQDLAIKIDELDQAIITATATIESSQRQLLTYHDVCLLCSHL